jgi:hypothetical protein
LVLLDAALDAYLNEGVLAAMPPAIPYTPRVQDWRAKRIENPARYWWQGLSPDRFDTLRPLFLKPSRSANAFELVGISEFRDTYRALYAAGCPNPKQQQALGLLANGFFGFTPRTRPILWRLLVCQARIYNAALQEDLASLAAEASAVWWSPNYTDRFPFITAHQVSEQLYEPFATTMAASTTYLQTFVTPRLSAALAAAGEH